MDYRKRPDVNRSKCLPTGHGTCSGVFCVRMWFTSGKLFDRVFDDYEVAREMANSMINKPSVDDVRLWEM